ncbi:MAG: DUF721 domain-containing protein [Betaproteobacteria bacterium]|nr:DUF721 domain-containing protein [Betaproteobacteria bacterium]
MHAKTLGAILDEANGINSLIPQAKRLLELRQLLSAALPPGLAPYCSVANWRPGRLVILAENNAIAAKLKLLRPTLTHYYLEHGIEATVIDIRVQPGQAAHPRPKKIAALSRAAADSLSKLAVQLPDSELKTAIAELAKRK